MADNLLDKASILLTPTAYNDGSMLSVKPENGDGDFTFSRSSAATRVNAQGLVENVQIISSELVSNGNFSQGGQDWTFGTGWSVDQANSKAVSDGASSFSSLYQNTPLSIGTKCIVKFDAVVNSGGFQGIGFEPFNQIDITSSGSYEFFTETRLSRFEFRTNSLFDGSITNISVKEITDDTDLPRIDYTDGCGSWLLEPQSTNLITYSEDFSQWTDEGIRMNIVLNSHTAPNGEMSAASAIPPNGEVFGSINMPLAMVSGTTYTQSVYAKPNGQDFVRIRIGSLSAYFNVSEGTIGTTSAGLTTSITESNNGFYRCVITGQFDGSDNYMRIYSSATDGSISTGDGVNGVYIWGAQTEQQSYATSYIPTNGATNTRLQDIATNSGNSTLINSTEGVLVFKPKYLVDNGASRKISISDGSSSNRLYITPYQGLTSRLRYIFTTGGVTQADLQITGLNLTSENIFAVVWDNNRFEFWGNGVKISEDTNGTTPSQGTFNILTLGSELNNNTELYQGFLDFIAVYKEALTDEQLQSLTTI